MTFQIHALEADEFRHLFDLPDDELQRLDAQRLTVRSHPGTPCRVSLQDAEIGEDVVLVHYEHQPAPTPYRASHAIFVRNNVARAMPAAGEVPVLFRHRLMSLRAFGENHMMIDADAVEGTELETAIERLFADPATSYIHLHYAKPGCYAALVTRDGAKAF